NSPSMALQDEYFTTWLNITDPYSNPIQNASVSLDFGTDEFILDEITPGRYLLNRTASLPIGNYSVRIIVQHPFVEGTSFGTYYMGVSGNLTTVASYESSINGGENFTVSVFIYDQYGTVPLGSWAIIEINGENFTALHQAGAEYIAEVNATYSIGYHNFVVYVGSDFGNNKTELFDLYVSSQPEVTIDSSLGWNFNQGESTTIALTLRDWSGYLVDGATVTALSPSNLAFLDHGDGTYSVELDTLGYPPGNYSLVISVSHLYLHGTQFSQNMIVMGSAIVDVSAPSVVFNNQVLRLNFTIVDIYGNPLSNFNYSFAFSDSFQKSGTSTTYHFSWAFIPNVYPGSHPLNMTINGSLLVQTQYTLWMDVFGISAAGILSPGNLTSFEQGTEMNYTVQVVDLMGYGITAAEVVVLMQGSTYSLLEIAPGVYSRNVSTVGFPLGQYTVTVGVTHTFLVSEQLELFLSLKGAASADLSVTPSPVQNKLNVTFNFTIIDQYGNPLSGFNYSLEFGGVYSKSGSSGSYKLSWTVLPNFVPGQYWLLLALNGTYITHSELNFSIDVMGVTSAQVMEPTSGASLTQGEPLTFVVQVLDEVFNNITGADVTLVVYDSTFALSETTPGIYVVTISTTRFPLGDYIAQIEVSQSFLETQQLTVSFSLVGDALVEINTDSTTLLNYENVTFDLVFHDQYGNPVTDFNYSIDFGGLYFISGFSDISRLSWTILPQVLPGTYVLNVTISGEYVAGSTWVSYVDIHTDAVATIPSPANGTVFVQGDDSILFQIDLEDMLGNVMSDCTVSVVVHDSVYGLNNHSNGTYSRVVSTAGWAAGSYGYTLVVTYDYFASETSLTGIVEVQAELEFSLELYPAAPQQGEMLVVNLTVTDRYGNMMSDLDVTVEFQNQTKAAVETAQSGKYTVSFQVASEGYGDNIITVQAEGELCRSGHLTDSVFVAVAIPQLSLDVESMTYLVVLSFIFTFIAMLGYFRISSGLSITRGGQEMLVRGIRRLDYIYFFVVGLAGLTVLHSFYSASIGDYGLAVLESVLLLGISLILYGIWLYRDASSTILYTQTLSRRRIVLGLWHLIFVPIVIVQVFDWGRQIDWLEFYVLQNVFHLGELAVPTMILTIFAAYLSSIVIVVVNLYREIGRSLERIKEMAVLGTPPVVVEQECIDLVEKMGSSIRIKFFMFLVVLAGTTVLTMDFLRTYSLGVIVLMPVLFVIVVPYLSSKMAKGVSRATAMLGRKGLKEPSLTEIADDEVVIEDVDDDVLAPQPEVETESEDEVFPDVDSVESDELALMTKSELIKLLPQHVKDSVGKKELKKLSKSAIEALLRLEEMESDVKEREDQENDLTE
ncbi:MAG: hypothetical protein JSW61_07300, partial [Candidatus Thorarchaeota archaeon]